MNKIISLALFLCLSVSPANAMMSKTNDNDNKKTAVKLEKTFYERGYYRSRPAKATDKNRTQSLKKIVQQNNTFLISKT